MTSTPTYRERLLPRWWAWLVPLGVVVMIAVAYGAALGPLAGWLIAVAGIGLVAVFQWTSAPVIEVSADGLSVDSASLPLSSIGAVEAVTADDITRLRGPGADARVFTALRPWAARDGVLVTLDDADDPHPAWLVSTRNPGGLVAALPATMGPHTTTDEPPTAEDV